jgi:hypothetical protein
MINGPEKRQVSSDHSVSQSCSRTSASPDIGTCGDADVCALTCTNSVTEYHWISLGSDDACAPDVPSVIPSDAHLWGTRQERAARARAHLLAQRLERRAVRQAASGNPARFPAIAQARIDARHAAGRTLLDDLPALQAYRRPAPGPPRGRPPGWQQRLYRAYIATLICAVLAGLAIVSDQWPTEPPVIYLEGHSAPTRDG